MIILRSYYIFFTFGGASMALLDEFNFVSLCIRLLLAMAAGGIVGYGRTKKKRSAGLRTYMLVSIGSAMSILIAKYDYAMFNGHWASIVAEVGMKFDASRMASGAVSGVGFLAAGAILKGHHQQVSGLTTAIGLFASMCMGLAAGAGFYEAVILSMVIVIFTMEMLGPVEILFKRKTRNQVLYIQFYHMEDINEITRVINEKDAKIYDINVETTKRKGDQYPSAVFSMQLGKGKASHSEMLATIAEMPCVFSVEELIA